MNNWRNPKFEVGEIVSFNDNSLASKKDYVYTEDLAFATSRELKKIGVDLDEWYRELERERHR